MLREFRRPARTILCALLVAAATAACGIKGPLKHPPKPSPAGDAVPAAGPPAAAKDAIGEGPAQRLP